MAGDGAAVAPPSRVLTKLAHDEPVSVLLLPVAHEGAVEMASTMGFDALWIDIQHAEVGSERFASLCRAARVGGSDVVVRAPRGEHARMSRLLDNGARGVMYPNCADAADARQALDWVKFPPLGRRSYSPLGPDGRNLEMTRAEYMQCSNESTFAVMMIEDPDGLGNAPEIAGTPGVDVLYFGAGDYKSQIGFTNKDDPTLEGPFQTMAAAARDAGKHWGRAATQPEKIEQLLGEGARFIRVWGDFEWMRRGLSGLRKDLTSIGFTF